MNETGRGKSKDKEKEEERRREGGRVPVKDIGNLALCLIPAGYLNSLCRNWRQRQGEGGRWKCLPIADSRNNGHIYGACVLYVAQGEPRSSQTECQKSKSKVRKQKPKQKSQSRWPKQKAARKTFRHTKAAARKGTREKQTFGAACLSGKYPGTRRNPFPHPSQDEERRRKGEGPTPTAMQPSRCVSRLVGASKGC